MPRLRVYDARLSRLPGLLGLCQGDVPAICGYLNAAQERLLKCREAGGESWWGTWAEVAFSLVSRCSPYITCPREIARIEYFNVCRRPVPIQNQFYEYLEFGNGRMPKNRCRGDNWGFVQAYSRNNTATFVDLSPGAKIIRVYATNPSDLSAARRVFLSGLDASGNIIYTQDTLNNVQGQFVNLESPFSDAPLQMTTITGVQKDPTAGPVQFFEVDPGTGVQTLILTMEPSEMVSGYRRYFLNNLPPNCCGKISNCGQPAVEPVQVLGIAKLEPIPVSTDTDYLLIQNMEALIHECQSVRYDGMDSPTAAGYAMSHHTQAIRLLQGELVHQLGKDKPACNYAPFGTARLERLKIGMI